MNYDPMRIGAYHRMDLVSEPGMIVLRRGDGSEVAGSLCTVPRWKRAGSIIVLDSNHPKYRG
jgi:hypothetical protein